MNPFLRFLLFLSIATCGLALYIKKQNQLTKVRIEIRQIEKKLQRQKAHNEHLSYEEERLEDPHSLMQKARDPLYSHLKYSNSDEVIIVQ